ncbi:GNAT family N-acetyltransferase [Nonomuraea sp. NPDC000554]|uniref:GNAT family N-acetyltransferase n=1 Tax=Nonomuraea sp. NPDC000554 TaxID=3154259 RepID=UPI00331EEF7C
MAYLIECPRPHDAAAIGQVHLRAWLQTYLNEDAGIDETWIRGNVGSVTTTEGIARWQKFIEEAEQQPYETFCRVARFGDEIVGLLCGRRDDVVTLGPMYLLEEVKGQGLGRRLMDEFLAWAGETSMRLWVTAYNERAIRFYTHYGFEMTGESELWKDKLPNVRMVRHSPVAVTPRGN